MELKNTGTKAIIGWSVAVTLVGTNLSVYNAWNFGMWSWNTTTKVLTGNNVNWNNSIQVGSTLDPGVGFNWNGTLTSSSVTVTPTCAP